MSKLLFLYDGTAEKNNKIDDGVNSVSCLFCGPRIVLFIFRFVLLLFSKFFLFKNADKFLIRFLLNGTGDCALRDRDRDRDPQASLKVGKSPVIPKPLPQPQTFSLPSAETNFLSLA